MPMSNRNKNLCHTAVRFAQDSQFKTVEVAKVRKATGIKHASTVLAKHGYYFGLRSIGRGLYGLKRYVCPKCGGYNPGLLMAQGQDCGNCKPKNFYTALNELPDYIGGYDSFSHHTPADLAWLVLLQMDLYNEGEDTEIKTKAMYRRCKKYVDKWIGQTVDGI